MCDRPSSAQSISCGLPFVVRHTAGRAKVSAAGGAGDATGTAVVL